MTTGLESVLPHARSLRSDEVDRIGRRVAVEVEDFSDSAFRKSLEEQSERIADEPEPDASVEEAAESAKPTEADPEPRAEASAAPADQHPQIVREAQEELSGEDETIAERVQSWEVSRSAQVDPTIGQHTAGASSAGVVEGQGAGREVRRHAGRESAASRTVSESPAPRIQVAEADGDPVREGRQVPGQQESAARDARSSAPAEPGESAPRKNIEPRRVDEGATPSRPVDGETRSPARVDRVDAQRVDRAERLVPVEPRETRQVSRAVEAARVVNGPVAGESGQSTGRGRDGETRDREADRRRNVAQLKQANAGAEARDAATSEAVREPTRIEVVEAARPVPFTVDAGGETVGKEPAPAQQEAAARGMADPNIAMAAARSASRALAAMLRQRGGTMSIGLSPETLGRVRIRMKVEGGRVEVELDAERESGVEALSSQLDVLKDALEARGLRVDHLEVRAASSPIALSTPIREGIEATA